MNQGKKWSTFLQKPKNPKPLPKKVEPEKPKVSEESSKITFNINILGRTVQSYY